jgi:hypothetical protein
MFKIAKSDRDMQGTRPSQQQSEQQERETETIHIDASSNVLAMFLDMMQSDPVPTNLDDGVLEAIATLADKYGCEVVIERVLLRASGSNPWEVFRLAVRYDYPQIAKLALTLMYREKDEARKTMSTTSLQLEWLVGIPLNYLVGLVSALGRWQHYEIQSRVYRTSVQGHHPHSRQLSIPFYSLSSAEQVGEYFEPMNRVRHCAAESDRADSPVRTDRLTRNTTGCSGKTETAMADGDTRRARNGYKMRLQVGWSLAPFSQHVSHGRTASRLLARHRW